MLSVRVLAAAVARIMPGEGLPNPLAKGIGAHLWDRFETDPGMSDIVQAGLILLEARDFVGRSEAEQDAILAELQTHPSIALLTSLCIEGFYTSPEGLADVGFRVTV